MGRIILHDTMGFLADFDPFGKQKFAWTPNAQHAWVFASHKSAMAAMRRLSEAEPRREAAGEGGRCDARQSRTEQRQPCLHSGEARRFAVMTVQP
jgi:hypothetical protein